MNFLNIDEINTQFPLAGYIALGYTFAIIGVIASLLLAGFIFFKIGDKKSKTGDKKQNKKSILIISASLIFSIALTIFGGNLAVRAEVDAYSVVDAVYNNIKMKYKVKNLSPSKSIINGLKEAERIDENLTYALFVVLLEDGTILTDQVISMNDHTGEPFMKPNGMEEKDVLRTF